MSYTHATLDPALKLKQPGPLTRIAESLGLNILSKPEHPDILDRLHAEHEIFKAMLDDMLKATTAARRSALFRNFKRLLTKHARAEEKVVYDRLTAKRATEDRLIGFEGNVEHELADALLMKASKLRNKMAPEWTATIKVLKEMLGHHIREEEGDVFGKVRELFKHAERDAMGLEFEAEKKKIRA